MTRANWEDMAYTCLMRRAPYAANGIEWRFREFGCNAGLLSRIVAVVSLVRRRRRHKWRWGDPPLSRNAGAGGGGHNSPQRRSVSFLRSFPFAFPVLHPEAKFIQRVLMRGRMEPSQSEVRQVPRVGHLTLTLFSTSHDEQLDPVLWIGGHT